MSKFTRVAFLHTWTLPQDFSILLWLFHPSDVGWNEKLHASSYSQPERECLNSPIMAEGVVYANWGRVGSLLLRSVKDAPWTREKEQVKLIYYRVPKKVRARQKPPVVRKSAVKWPPPSRACVTTTALDMGQRWGKCSWNSLRITILVLLGCDIYFKTLNGTKLNGNISRFCLNWVKSPKRRRAIEYFRLALTL